MTLTTSEGACEVFEPIEYHFDGSPQAEGLKGTADDANGYDTPETVARITKFNAALEALCKGEDQ